MLAALCFTEKEIKDMSFDFAQIRRSETMQSEHTSAVTISEFETVIKSHPEISIGIDPEGPKVIKSSTKDRKATAILEPKSALFMKDIEGCFIYYDFYEGIAIHINKNDIAIGKIQQIAKELNANAFFFN